MVSQWLQRIRDHTGLPFIEDKTHLHCIDCGKLFIIGQSQVDVVTFLGHEIQECPRCGAMMPEYCDGRCAVPEVTEWAEASGLHWERMPQQRYGL